MHCCTAARLHGYTAARLHGCTAARLHGCAAARLHCCTAAQTYCCTAALIHRCTATLLHCCTAALLNYHSTTVLIYLIVLCSENSPEARNLKFRLVWAANELVNLQCCTALLHCCTDVNILFSALGYDISLGCQRKFELKAELVVAQLLDHWHHFQRSPDQISQETLLFLCL